MSGATKSLNNIVIFQWVQKFTLTDCNVTHLICLLKSHYHTSYFLRPMLHNYFQALNLTHLLPNHFLQDLSPMYFQLTFIQAVSCYGFHSLVDRLVLFFNLAYLRITSIYCKIANIYLYLGEIKYIFLYKYSIFSRKLLYEEEFLPISFPVWEELHQFHFLSHLGFQSKRKQID